MRNRGFTLIELMIVVAIVGILAAIAYPSYQNHIQKTRRSDAMIALGRLATLQEQYFFRENKYTDQFSDLGDASLSASSEGYYSIALSITGTGETYTATATATGPQAADTACAVFSVNNLGRKSAKTDADADSTAQCW